MITDFDDFMIHQTSDPVAQPASSDRNFYDRYWFNGFDGDGEFVFEIGFGVYPNRRVMDAHWSVVLDGHQHCLHASRRAPKERSETRVGPLRIEVVKPMRWVVASRADPSQVRELARLKARLGSPWGLGQGPPLVMAVARVMASVSGLRGQQLGSHAARARSARACAGRTPTVARVAPAP